MNAEDKTSNASEPHEGEPEITPKQAHRWKDDGGAVADEADVDRDLPDA